MEKAALKNIRFELFADEVSNNRVSTPTSTQAAILL